MFSLAFTVFLLLPSLSLCSNHHNLSSAYQFNTTLREGEYWLHWSFNETVIRFAVRVKTTGWAGFGLSPNGGMSGSDIVLGWLDGTDPMFRDYYAVSEATPLMDSMQNWFLTNIEEDDGYTVMEFYRNITSCDNENDLNILAEPMTIIYAWSTVKPSAAGIFQKHSERGSTVLNLIGRFDPMSSIDERSTRRLVVGVENAVVTVNGSYWCRALRLPQSIRTDPKYITKFSARISSGNEGNISHMIVQVCKGLENEDLSSNGSSCSNVNTRVTACFNEDVIGVWGRGGEDFVYPDNVAYKFGGTDDPLFAVIRIKYSPPSGVTALSDSSGIEFTYTSTPRRYNAGILYLGHTLYHNMVIPPGAVNFTVLGLCSGTCTKNYLPADGINVFANLFIAGSLNSTTLEISHTRDISCSGNTVSTGLKSLDRNLFYSSDRQKINYFFNNNITIQPGDSLIMRCNYTTQDRTKVTLGGAGQNDEACLSFSVYYPYTGMSVCTSYPDFNNFDDFINKDVSSSDQSDFRGLELSLHESHPSSYCHVASVMNQLDWSRNNRINAYERKVYTEGKQWSTCPSIGFSTDLPDSSCCGYEPDSVCTTHTSTPCCQRQCAMRENGAGMISVSLLVLVFSALLILLI